MFGLQQQLATGESGQGRPKKRPPRKQKKNLQLDEEKEGGGRKNLFRRLFPLLFSDRNVVSWQPFFGCCVCACDHVCI